jgi:hypothetical protein
MMVRARFSGFGDVRAIEVGCSGYASTDGANWGAGETDRTLARLLAPSIDDSMVVGTTWRDMGTATVGGTAVRHLEADVTAQSLAGAAPSADATPHPGVSVAPTTIDVWMRVTDGSVSRISEHLDMTADLRMFRTPAYPDELGTVHSVLTGDVTMSPSRTSVQAPSATLSTDPAAAISLAFGPFGVQTDNC